MSKRFRRKNRKTLMIVGIALGIALFLIAAYFMQTHDKYKNTEYGDIGKITVDQDDFTESEEDRAAKENRMPLKCMVIECGDALAILIDIGSTEVLYDCGYAENGKDIANKISSYVDDALDYLIVSHSHADHAGGVPAITSVYDVNTVITSGEKKGSSEQFNAAMKAIKQEGCTVLDDEDMSFDLGNNAQLTIYENLDPKQDDNPNNLSVIATVKYYGETILLTGDAEKDAERRLRGKFEDVTLYVAGHHMSSTSNSAALLQEWSPDYIVASCAGPKVSEYGFPHKEALKRCLAATTQTYATYKSGDVIFTTNGTTNEIKCKREGVLVIEDAA